TSTLKNESWEKKSFVGTELGGKTLGIIGYGNIGRRTATLARGLGMRVLVYVRHPEAISPEGVEVATLDELLAQSDFISLHLPKNEDSANMIGREQFARMKDGVYIINCARGGIIDEDALYEALTSGKVAGAALDVFSEEPPTD